MSRCVVSLSAMSDASRLSRMVPLRNSDAEVIRRLSDAHEQRPPHHRLRYRRHLGLLPIAVDKLRLLNRPL